MRYVEPEKLYMIAKTALENDLQITAHIDQLKRYLIGRDPRNIKHFTQSSFDDFAAFFTL